MSPIRVPLLSPGQRGGPLRLCPPARRTARLAGIWFALFGLLFGLSPLTARAENLADLEALADGGRTVLPAMADLEEAMALNRRAEALSGFKLLGGAGLAYSDEPNTPGQNDRIDYTRMNGRLGVALPILGGWAQDTMARLDAQARVATSRQQLEEAKTVSLASLRRAWIVRWVEARKRNLLSAYLKNERQVDAALKARLTDNLILPGQYRALMATYEMVRRERDQSLELEERGKVVIRLATGQDIPLDRLTEPDLPRPLARERLLDYVLSEHPEVRNLNEAAAFLSEKHDSARLADLDVRLEASWGLTHDLYGFGGNGGQIGVMFEMPLSIFEASHSGEEAAEAATRRARYTADLKREELAGDLAVAFRTWEAAQAALQESAASLAASAESLRTARLRQNEVPGPTFELALEARLNHLSAGLAALNRLAECWSAQAEILRLAPGPNCVEPNGWRDLLSAQAQAERILKLAGPGTMRVEMPSAQAGAPVESRAAHQTPLVTSGPLPPWNLGAYVWRAEPFLGPNQREELQALAAAGFSRLLLSFTGQELTSLRRDQRPLWSLLAEARTQGLAVELLLGDPSWILPEHRPELLNILKDLAVFPFTGLHLDLEQDQLPGAEARRDELARLTAETLAEVLQVSPWPMGFSIHHRYLDPEGPTPWFSGRLAGLPLREAAVMAYITNEERLIPLFKRIVDNTPGLTVTLARSIENTLPTTESYGHAGRKSLREALDRVRKAVPNTNFKGGLVQSWEEFKRAPL